MKPVKSLLEIFHRVWSNPAWKLQAVMLKSLFSVVSSFDSLLFNIKSNCKIYKESSTQKDIDPINGKLNG